MGSTRNQSSKILEILKIQRRGQPPTNQIIERLCEDKAERKPFMTILSC